MVNSPQTSNVGVSIVVATFNRPESLARLLDDLTKQAVMSLRADQVEIVVVDDGGKVDLQPAIPVQPPFELKVLSQANGGPASARHTGISHSSGRIVVILDDDMRVGSGFVQAHLDAHKNGAEVVYGLIAGDDQIGPLFARYHQMHIDRWLEECRSGDVPRGDRLCTGNVSFSRSAYDAVGGFDTSLVRCEDRDLGIRLEHAKYRFAYCEAALSTHDSGIHDTHDWRLRNEIYGGSDVAISTKHMDKHELSPWAFLGDLPKPVHPLLITVAAWPALSRPIGSLVYRFGEQFDQKGRVQAALRLAGLTYGIDYYGGAGRKWGGPTATLRALRSWTKNRRTAS